MNEGSGALVFWILVPLFAGVGLYLVWYSRHRKKKLVAFANKHQLHISPELEEDLQKTLDASFSLKTANLVRSFGQLSNLIDGGPILVFQAVELLDLNPHAQSYSTHFPRIVALFDVSTDHNEFFLVDKSGQAIQRPPKSNPPNSEIAGTSKRIAASCNARHPLSVTFAHGHGLIYFEPLLTGGETVDDVSSLYCIAKSMQQELT